MESLDYLIAFVKSPQAKEFRDKGRVIALSFECGDSAHGNSPEEAAKNLATLLRGHLKVAADKGINPFYTNIEEFEAFGKYCVEKKRLPKRLTNHDIGYELTLVSYDMTDV